MMLSAEKRPVQGPGRGVRRPGWCGHRQHRRRRWSRGRAAALAAARLGVVLALAAAEAAEQGEHKSRHHAYQTALTKWITFPSRSTCLTRPPSPLESIITSSGGAAAMLGEKIERQGNNHNN
ncbi:hypothetical protein BS78_08G044000 [Paspalum vaginatum]|nr:hypothetical protein BS78_08G044000 [Paspalum vaginatum]KAJ1265000.1 hypothetical protein BS78_08G044000 [Paspalum vaginatum]